LLRRQRPHRAIPVRSRNQLPPSSSLNVRSSGYTGVRIMPVLSAMRFAATAACVLGVGGCGTVANVDAGQVKLDYQARSRTIANVWLLSPTTQKLAKPSASSWKPTNAAFNKMTGKRRAIQQRRPIRYVLHEQLIMRPPCVMETSTFVIASAQRIWPISKPL
jgi:hypothetical protein